MLSSVWRQSTKWFVTGLILGGMASGLLFGVAGLAVSSVLPSNIRLVSLAFVLVVLGVFEFSGRSYMLPQNRRQVPATVRVVGDISGPLQFGFEMGTGARTYLTSALPLGVAALCIFWAEGVFLGVLAGCGFGVGRAVMIPLRTINPEHWDRRLKALKPLFVGVLVASFVTCVVQLVSQTSDIL